MGVYYRKVVSIRIMGTVSNRFSRCVVKILAGACLLVVLVMTGCSKTSLAYGWLDKIIYSYITDYIPFDRYQRRHLNASLGRLHYWHRCEELPLRQ